MNPLSLLGSISLELTNFCNLSCWICWSQNPVLYPPREKEYMDPELFTDIIDQLVSDTKSKPKDKIWLSLSYGGESLLHPKFDDLLEYAASTRAFKIQLITNGVLLKDHIPSLTRNKVQITVSYHKYPDELKDQVDRNILSLMARRGPTPMNVAVVDAESPGLYREARAKFGGIVYNYPLITEDLKYVDHKWVKPSYCRFPFSNMAVLWNGDVWPCCRLLSSDFPSLGNLNESTLQEVWGGSLYDSVRRNPELFPCGTCEVY